MSDVVSNSFRIARREGGVGVDMSRRALLAAAAIVNAFSWTFILHLGSWALEFPIRIPSLGLIFAALALGGFAVTSAVWWPSSSDQ